VSSAKRTGVAYFLSMRARSFI